MKLNESFNTILSSLYIGDNIGLLNRLFKALVKHGYSLNKLDEKDIMKVSPRQSMLYSGSTGDEYCKIWIRPNGGIAFCTWANTMIDDNFNWDPKARNKDERRDNGKIIGDRECIIGYLKKTSWVYNSKNVEYCLMLPFSRMGNLEFIRNQRKRNFEDPKRIKETAMNVSLNELFKEFDINPSFKITVTSYWLDRTEKEYSKKMYERNLGQYLNKTEINILRRLYACKNMFQPKQQVYNTISDKFYDLEIKVHSIPWVTLENFNGPKGLYNHKMYQGYPKYYKYELEGEFPIIKIKYNGDWVTLLEFQFAEQKEVYEGKQLIKVNSITNYKRYIPIL